MMHPSRLRSASPWAVAIGAWSGCSRRFNEFEQGARARDRHGDPVPPVAEHIFCIVGAGVQVPRRSRFLQRLRFEILQNAPKGSQALDPQGDRAKKTGSAMRVARKCAKTRPIVLGRDDDQRIPGAVDTEFAMRAAPRHTAGDDSVLPGIGLRQ